MRLLNHSYCLVPGDLDIRCDNVVLDQPVVQVRVGPSIPNTLRSFVVVQAHLVDEGCTRFLNLVGSGELGIREEVVGSEPLVL